MASLLIRVKSRGWVTFIHNESELKDFVDNYLPGRHLIIGDVATFTPRMKSQLLKLIEENPAIDVYSSVDIQDCTLLSRFVHIEKEPLNPIRGVDVEKFLTSPRSHMDTVLYLDSYPYDVKLRAPIVPRQLLKVIL